MSFNPIDHYRLFGRTGVKVSPLALGTMNFGRRTELPESIRIVERALDAGINIIDTSNSYSRGISEEHTGEALQRSGRRHQVVLASKVHFAMDDADPNQQGNSRRFIVEQVEASLRRLKTDYLDLYQIHRPQPHTAIDETLRALDDLVRAGKVRYTGTTTFAGWQLVEALWASKELGLARFVSEQPPYNLLDRRIERELLPATQTFGLAVLPWSPIAGGLLTGKYRRGEAPPADSRLANQPNGRFAARRLNDRVHEVLPLLEHVARDKGVPLSQLALAWVVQRPGVTSAITGPRTVEQLDDAIAALKIAFTPDELARIDEIVPPGTHVSPFYEADFGASQHRW